MIWFGYIIREDFYLPPRRLDEREGGSQYPALLMKGRGMLGWECDGVCVAEAQVYSVHVHGSLKHPLLKIRPVLHISKILSGMKDLHKRTI